MANFLNVSLEQFHQAQTLKLWGVTYFPSWVTQGWLSAAVLRWNNPDCNRVAPAASPGVIKIWRLSLESSGNAEIKSV